MIIVVDQLANHYFAKLCPFLKNGIRFLLNNGIVYENAYYPHAVPSTGPGHTNLAAGITSDYTGITANNWCDPDGNKIGCDDDDKNAAAVINPKGGYYDYGKGPAHIMTDTISDQFGFSSQPGASRVAISLSLKSRSAICTANKMGKAIWFDDHTGYFTSSRAYYENLPAWLMQFNRQKGIDRLCRVSWPLYYPPNSQAYNFKFINDYDYSNRAPIAGKTVTVNEADNFELYQRTPAANQLLFDLALHCIKTHVTRKSCQEMMLWVCLSPLDMVGHEYGPDSREVIDMIYHLDCQIARFMDQISCYLKRTDVLFVLTADHGVTPIPELLNKEGYESAQRLNYKKIVPMLNNMIAQQFGIDNLISACRSSQLFFKESLFKSLAIEEQNNVLLAIKQELLHHPGIKRVWTPQELANSWYDLDQIESFYKRQMYPGRTGRLIIQPQPYCVLDDYGKGTGHRSPYEPDTHVPLILYQKHNLEKRIIYEKVWTLQLANSLAFILHIQKPSASTYTMLPGLIDYDPITGEVLQPIIL